MQFIVTIKLPRNPQHDPKNKLTGACPVSAYCNDVTGAHHSYLAVGDNVDEVLKRATEMYGHVTRVEVVVFD